MKYYCEHCQVIVKNSICPSCTKRTNPLKQVNWCTNCNIPVLDEVCPICNETTKYISSDIRPVFPEERLLIEVIVGRPFEFINASVWCNGSGGYFVNGIKIPFTIKKLKQMDHKKIRSLYQELLPKNSKKSFELFIERFIDGNKHRFNTIDNEALQYIHDKVHTFEHKEMFVSFSGGKDSTVTSDLVMRALGSTSIVHIFGDTTLEFPETYEYIKRFKESYRKTPMISSRNKEKDFFELCKQIGPPSRVMRWCCTVFKTGAITKKINILYKNKTRIITFYGIRRSESLSRSKYDRDSDSPKITKQRTISPIIDWFDFDVWLYLLTRKIDFNEAYRKGFSRVGCWCCPNNSFWSEFLSSIHHEKDFLMFRDLLIDNAMKIGKPDPIEYVESGAWKAKQGGEGIDSSKSAVISFESCELEENTYNYVLQKPINKNLYELFKPLGKLNFELGNKKLGEVYVFNIKGEIVLKLQGRIGQENLKVSIINPAFAGAKNYQEAESRVKNQLTKFQMCINCTGCVSVCKFGAINISYEEELHYRIDENKCVHCNECITHYQGGCYMKKILRVKKED